jgi:8-oxo-dGTP diphosphatase
MQKKVEIYHEKPSWFTTHVEVAAAYIAIEGKILLLQRSEHKNYPKLWGVPAGKFEKDEMPEHALRRELFEETGIALEAHNPVYALEKLYIRRPEMEYIYHPFEVVLSEMPTITLSDEHMSYTWIPFDQAKTLDLIDGAHDALQHYLKHART